MKTNEKRKQLLMEIDSHQQLFCITIHEIEKYSLLHQHILVYSVLVYTNPLNVGSVMDTAGM